MAWLLNMFRMRILDTRVDMGAETEEPSNASQLLLLPPEIILLVARSLPMPGAACLALCNRRLSHILGRESWSSLRTEGPDARFAFLISLAKDLPQYFICQQCACLHRISTVKWPRLILSDLGPRCITNWRTPSYRFIYFSRYRIYFPHIQLAIEQHYRGTNIGFPLAAFQRLEVEYDQTQQKTTLCSVDSMIVSNELLMRSQTWILLPWKQRSQFVDGLLNKCLSNNICIHTRLGPMKRNLLSDLVSCRLDQLEAQEEYHSQTIHCPYCWVDYVLDAVDFGQQGFAVLITRWINLGHGLDPADAKWQSHITIRMGKGIHQQHAAGVIRTSFENQAEVSMDDLTDDNKTKLFSRRQNCLISRSSDGLVWKWNRGDWWYLAPSGPPERSFWEVLKWSLLMCKWAEDGCCNYVLQLGE